MRNHQKFLRELLKDCAGGEPRSGAEIGVATGETSAVLLKAFPELKLFMIDAWCEWSIRHPYYLSGDHRARMTLEEQLARMKQAFEHTKFAGQRAIILRYPSDEIAEKFRPSSLDFVFIDGAHDYKSVLTDMQCWFSKVRPGGVFCGHDYGSKKYVDVKRAVDDFAEAYKLRFRFGDSGAESVWYYWKPEERRYAEEDDEDSLSKMRR